MEEVATSLPFRNNLLIMLDLGKSELSINTCLMVPSTSCVFKHSSDSAPFTHHVRKNRPCCIHHNPSPEKGGCRMQRASKIWKPKHKFKVSWSPGCLT